MEVYIALLRGVNVGGNNKIAMPELKAAFQAQGFSQVRTYINSGNIVFESALDAAAAKAACEAAIAGAFGLDITVCIITAAELRDALAHAPDWWNSSAESKHNAIFVIPPATAKAVCAIVGEAKPEYERVAYHGKVIFWSAPLATFNHTRWAKVTQNKAAYNAITIRNANTALKLLALVGGRSMSASSKEQSALQELEKARQAIESMIGRSRKAQEKFARGTSQHTLQENRIHALQVAVALVSREVSAQDAPVEYTHEELERALAPLASLVSKSTKAQGKLAQGTWQHTMLGNNLKALRMASPLLARELGVE